MAVANLYWCLIAWRSNHLLSKFTNSIQHLFEMAVDCLYRPSLVLVYNSKALVMADNMKKHCNLLFYTKIYGVYTKQDIWKDTITTNT